MTPNPYHQTFWDEIMRAVQHWFGLDGTHRCIDPGWKFYLGPDTMDFLLTFDVVWKNLPTC